MLQFFCGDSAGNATVSLNIFITSSVARITPVGPSLSSTPQVIGLPFTVQPSFKLCQESSVLGQCIPVPGQVVVAVAESYVSDGSLDGNKMARLSGHISAKSDAFGLVQFTNLAVIGSSSQRVYFSFYAGGKAWCTWDGSSCSPSSASRCLSYVQLTGGPLIQKLSISSTPSVVMEGTAFPPIIISAFSSNNAPIPNMVMYAQFSRIADAAAPKFTTPLKFGKKLFRAVAVTNQEGRAQFNLNTSIGGFAGVYDITFLPSVTSSLRTSINLPFMSVLIATSVASVTFQGPSVVVRTIIRVESNQMIIGHPVETTLADMQSTDYPTFFLRYFNGATPSMKSPKFEVFSLDAGSNFVADKLVEMISDPPNVLDLFADSFSVFGIIDRFSLPVILSATGSSVLYLKSANPIPLAMWPQPPVQLHGINTARFYFVIDGVKSSSFVTVFLTPPVPLLPMSPSVVFSNIGPLTRGLFANADTQASISVLFSLCVVTSGYDDSPFNSSSCALSDTHTYSSNLNPPYSNTYCVPSCLPSLSQLLQLWYQFWFPRFLFVVPPIPVSPLSRVVSRATVGSTPFSLQYGFTTFDGSPFPEVMLVVAEDFVKRFRSSSIASSQGLVDSPPNNVYQTTELRHVLMSNSTTWLPDVIALKKFCDKLCVNVSTYNFSFAPSHFIQSMKLLSPLPPSSFQFHAFFRFFIFIRCHWIRFC